MQYFGMKLKKLREDRGMSQTELGNKIGVSGSTVSAYEKSRKYPTLETFAKICSILKVSSDYLLGISDNMHLMKSELTDIQMINIRAIIQDLEQFNLLRSTHYDETDE